MSAAYFGGEETKELPKFLEGNEDIMLDSKKCDGGDCRSLRSGDSKPDVRLHEMGEAIEIAENRCNTLKQQLDFMKKLYKPKCEAGDAHKKDTHRSRSSSSKIDRQVSNYVPIPQKQSLVRQNSQAITTDNSGAAVITINNILNGITTSINRLSQLHTFMEVDASKTSVKKKSGSRKYGPIDRCRINDTSAYCHTPNNITNYEECTALTKIDSKDFRKHAKRRSSGSLDGSTSQFQTTRISKSSTRRIKTAGKDESAPHETSSTLLKKRKYVKRFKPNSKVSIVRKNTRIYNKDFRENSKHLVELYLNSAAKESDSDDSMGPIRDHSQIQTKISHVEVKSRRKPDAIPPIQVNDKFSSEPSTLESKDGQENRENKDSRCLSPIEEQIAVDPDNMEYNNYSHNYELPTIASKMKQVAKSYFRQFDFKTIPFCAAKSTSPSHNIGINIQQVMSIIKARQPIQGLSPTLAHNIGIAAEKLQNRPLSDLVSTIGSRMGCSYSYMQCPLAKSNVNYQQLQELAKDIPEETCEEVEQFEKDTKNDVNSIWSVDPNNETINCTCVPRQGIGFQQVVNRYQSCAPAGDSQNSEIQANTNNVKYAQKISKQTANKYKHIRSIYAQNNKRRSQQSPVRTLIQTKPDEHLPLKGKEKVLKGVLCNLHNEFAKLTSKYDELSRCLENDDGQINNKAMKQLEQLEKKLNDKEEEIMMVMSLYKEVVTLKEQVKALKEKASIASIFVQKQQQQTQQQQQQYQRQFNNEQCYSYSYNNQYQYNQTQYNNQPQYYQQRPQKHSQLQLQNTKYKEYKDCSAAFQLQKLLKQIQSYQDFNRN